MRIGPAALARSFFSAFAAGRVSRIDLTMGAPPRVAIVLTAEPAGPAGALDPDRAAVLERLDTLFEDVLCGHGGTRSSDGENERFLARFSRARDALAFALHVQCAIASEASARGLGWTVRIALHAGEAPPGDPDAERLIARRCRYLRDAGYAGQTLLTRAVRELVVQELPKDVVLIDLGTVRLRDLSRPERVYQVVQSGVEPEFPQLRSIDAVPNNLPLQRTSFVGREAELAGIRRLVVAGNRLVTLTGAGGCGKTRLALHLAADLAPDFVGGAWWIDLAKLGDASLLPNVIAAPLAIKEVQGERLLDIVARRLRQGPTLLLLDNCEHVIADCAALVHELLDACPSLSCLATSREPLGVDGEIAWRVPALRLPAEQASAAQVASCEAVRLFADRASQVQQDFRITEGNAGAVAAICIRLDGIPLAIELAAARMRMLTADQILAGLKDRFRLLTGGMRTTLPRHRTLRASVDWSFGLLSDDERVVLRRLAVFAGGFQLDAAESVCMDANVMQERVLDSLTALVDRSLVHVEEGARVARYYLLETIRQYASDRLIESGETEAIRTRHLRFFLALAEQAQPEFERAGLIAWLPRLDAELDNIRAALDWSLEAQLYTDGLRLASALWLFWLLRGHLTEGKQRFELALKTGDTSPSLKASALAGLGQLLVLRGDLGEAATCAREALVIARAQQDRRLEGRALDALAYSTAFLDPPAAPRLFEQSVSVSREAGDGPFVADALNGLGISHYLAGDYRSATTSLLEGVASSRESGNAATLTVGLAVLGYCLALQGRLARAQTCLRESLVTARRLRDRVFEAQSLFSLGLIGALRGEPAHAETLLEESIDIARESSPLMVAFALLTHGLARYVAGDINGSQPRLEEALALARKMALPWITSWSLAFLGNAARMSGCLDEADEHIQEALALMKSKGLRTDVPIDAAARLARAVGDLDLAESLHHDALKTAHAIDSVLLVPVHLESLAGLAGLAERFHEAARLFGAAEAAREALGLVRYAPDRDQYHTDVDRVRIALLAVEFRAAWDEGRAMSLEQASSYCARGRGERKRASFGWGSLTPTEVEVVRYVAQGLTNPEVARRLFVSRSTVKAHLAHIFAKVGVSTRAELAAKATHRGLSAHAPPRK
jgi:predicted ATPase/DNA-binding CsgD family transcriptional regulator